MNGKKTFSKYRLWCTKPSKSPALGNEHDNLPLQHTPLKTPDLIKDEDGNNQHLDNFLHQNADISQRSLSATTFQNADIRQGRLSATALDQAKCQLNLQDLDDTEQSQINYLSLFGLVTTKTSEVLQKKSLERKKRSCSSPHFLSLIIQAEKQDLDGNDPPEAKQRKRNYKEVIKKKENVAVSPDMENSLKVITVQPPEEENGIGDYHEELCHVCNNVGELLLCDTCPYVYHLLCAQLSEIPDGKWFCKFCQDKLPPDFEIPSVTEETVSLQCKGLEDKITDLLKQTFILRSEKLNLLKTVKEVTTMLQNKDDLEKSYIEKINRREELKKDIDKFLCEL